MSPDLTVRCGVRFADGMSVCATWCEIASLGNDDHACDMWGGMAIRDEEEANKKTKEARQEKQFDQSQPLIPQARDLLHKYNKTNCMQ